MKKKILNIFAGIVLGAAFIAAAAFAVSQSHEEKEPETEKELKVKIPEALTPYQTGEEVQAGDFLWKVSEAEIIDNYESLDDYYKQRGYLKAPDPDRQNPFAEEQRFLRVKFSVKNISENTDREFSFIKLGYANYRGEGIFDKWELYFAPWYNKGSLTAENGSFQEYSYPGEERFFDGWCEVRNSSKTAGYFDDFSNVILSPGETLDAECIVQFYEYGNIYEYSVLDAYKDLYTKLYIYDLCLLAFGTGASRDQYISLDIAPKHMNVAETDIDNTYEEQRDIAGMKAAQMTNLDMKQYQDSGYPVQRRISSEIYEDGEPEEEPKEQIVSEDYRHNSTLWIYIKKSEITEWKDMPEVFRNQGYLKKAAQRYKSEYGYSEDQLKVLLLHVSYTRNSRMDSFYFCIYDYTWLFTRDENEKRWVFGTADDWTVLSNGAHPDRTGHINTEWIQSDQSINVLAAYILPPDIYEQEEALYFCAGTNPEGFCPEVSEIKLK